MTKFLKDFTDFLETQPFKIIRLSQQQGNGETETFTQTEANACQNIYSVAKTFTATAIGLLYDKGFVKMNEKICDIFADEIKNYNIDERWKNSTVDMALRHTLGLPGGFLDIDTTKSSQFTDNYLKYLFEYPLQYTPGTESRYSDGAFYLLSCIVEKKSGMTTDAFLWREMLLEMDYQEFSWAHCPKGHAMGATGLYITSEDMVKLAMLYRDGGIYRGKRILSEEWVKLAVEKEYGLDWDDTHRIYYKGGMFGQKLIVVPEQNRAVALQAYGANSQIIAEWIRDYK